MNLNLYYISSEYIEYLRKFDNRIYDNKGEKEFHIRKYLGIVLKIGVFNYYVPFSSPKSTDFIDKEKTIVRKSIIPIIRIVQNSNPNRLYGTLRISNMIPVPISEIKQYKIENETDKNYKNLILAEIKFIKKNEKMIIGNSHVLYKQKENELKIPYVENSLNFKFLEQKCIDYMNSKSIHII